MAKASSEVMRIAESYFQGLLRASDGLGPVGELAGMWAPRAETLGLTRAERVVDAFLIYTGEVGNGGHHQFFWNRGRVGAIEARVALREMKLDDLADILDDAIRLFPGGTVPADRDAIDAFYATCAERGQHARAESLDQAVYAIDDADDRALAYLREHEEEVLRPERGLPALATCPMIPVR